MQTGALRHKIRPGAPAHTVKHQCATSSLKQPSQHTQPQAPITDAQPHQSLVVSPFSDNSSLHTRTCTSIVPVPPAPRGRAAHLLVALPQAAHGHHCQGPGELASPLHLLANSHRMRKCCSVPGGWLGFIHSSHQPNPVATSITLCPQAKPGV